MARLNALKAQVVGAIVNDPYSNKAFAEANQLEFPLLSDYSREVVMLYGVPLTNFAGLKGCTVAKRSVFIIDKKGTVRYVWIRRRILNETDYNN